MTFDMAFMHRGEIEIGGTPFVIERVKVVRESDGALSAHIWDAAARPPTIIVADRIC